MPDTRVTVEVRRLFMMMKRCAQKHDERHICAMLRDVARGLRATPTARAFDAF